MSRASFATFVEELQCEPEAPTEIGLFRLAKRHFENDAQSTVDLEAAAYEKGYGDGQERAREELDQLCKDHRSQLSAALEEQRRSQIEQDGALLAARLVGALNELELALVERVRPVLQGLLETAIVERALGELGQILRRAIATDGALEMTISASAELIEAVKKQLPAGWNRATFIVAEGAGIKVEAGDVDMSVELGAWRREIAGGDL